MESDRQERSKGSAHIFNDLIGEDKEMEKWRLEIEKADNGYILRGEFGCSERISEMVVEECDEDSLGAIEAVLHEVLDYFGMRGSKHDEERILIGRQERDSE